MNHVTGEEIIKLITAEEACYSKEEIKNKNPDFLKLYFHGWVHSFSLSLFPSHTRTHAPTHVKTRGAKGVIPISSGQTPIFYGLGLWCRKMQKQLLAALPMFWGQQWLLPLAIMAVLFSRRRFLIEFPQLSFVLVWRSDSKTSSWIFQPVTTEASNDLSKLLPSPPLTAVKS